MSIREYLTITPIVLLFGLCLTLPSELMAQVESEAFGGVVSSQQEGNMEGVVVTARKIGANFDVSVVSNEQGRYSFPRTHLDPGYYNLKIRAVGYELGSRDSVDVVSDQPATLDLTLVETQDLSSQLNSVEWLMSIDGTDEQKAMVVKQIMSCTYCHSLERIIKSNHNAEQMVNVITRMMKYFPDGSMAGTEGRGRAQFHSPEMQEFAEQNEVWGFAPGVNKSDLAAYLATINTSDGKALPTELKVLPRPSGKDTQVIITQYDMPRKSTVPHDMDVDSTGTPWYTDQSRPFLGKMDPQTGVFTEYEFPVATTHAWTGGSDVQVDADDNIWFPLTTDKTEGHFGWPVKFDPKTETWETADMPEGVMTQFFTLGPDGKIWSGFSNFVRINPDTLEVEYQLDWTKADNLPPGPHSGYEPAVDSQGNPYITDFGGSYIVKADVETDEVKFFKVPTPNSQPRRGRMDSQDRFWFAEYTGDKIAMLDTKTEQFKEWSPSMKWAGPYTSSLPNNKGRVFAPSSMSDRLLRLDPATDEIVEYLLPTQDFDAKQLQIDPIGGRAVWLANVRNARLVKIEPID